MQFQKCQFQFQKLLEAYCVFIFFLPARQSSTVSAFSMQKGYFNSALHGVRSMAGLYSYEDDSSVTKQAT